MLRRISPIGIAAVAVAVLIALMLRARIRDQVGEPVHVAAPAAVLADQDSAYAAVLARVMIEKDGLRGQVQQLQNRLRGLQALRPDTVFHVDTVLMPDTIAGLRSIAPSGRADIRVYTRADTIGYRPSFYSVDVGKCDRGLVVGAEGVVCRTAPLGHVSLFLRGELSARPLDDLLPEARAQAGLAWKPQFRSETLLEVSIDQQRRAAAAVRLGIRLF